MRLDFDTLAELHDRHPAWRLLRSDHAPLVVSFLHRAFVAPNTRAIAGIDLAEALEDELYALRQRLGPDAFPRPARDYLNEWCEPGKGWLRKYYGREADAPLFELTPGSEKAIAWLASLTERSFVGTESRLMTLFDLLRQLDAGADMDPAARLADLHRRRSEIDAAIRRMEAGDLPVLDDTAIRERFQQFAGMARELLADFREVEDNFRRLDRHVRERIARWDGAKGVLLEEVFGQHDAIEGSDQGRSFRGFYEFLMSGRQQETWSEMLERVLALPVVAAMDPDPRLRRIHYDWLEAGEHVLRTMSHLSEQLRRFLDDQAWLENRRIMDLLHGIEVKALALRGHRTVDLTIPMDELRATLNLPFERPLFAPGTGPALEDPEIEDDEPGGDAAALFAQMVVDRAELAAHVRRGLQLKAQVTLRELVEARPLRHGLAELVAYLNLGESESFRMAVDESTRDDLSWQATGEDGNPVTRLARLPRIIFVR